MAVKGVLPVIPTPLRDDRFDEASFQRLLDHMLGDVDGYTLLGSTGEAPSMTVSERMQVAERALAMTPNDKTVVVGVASTSIADSVALARHAQEHGAAGVLCPSPYYFLNTPDGPLRFFEQLDAALEVDLVLYDNPVSTKTTLGAEQVIGWAKRLPHLTTVKLTDHDLRKIDAWHAAGLNVLAGDDPIAFRYLAAGVDGVMIIAPAVFPRAFRQTWDAVQAGDLAAAFEPFAREIAPFIHVFGIGDEIAPTKAALLELGIFADDELRPPLERTSDARRELLRLGLAGALAERAA
jgi:4-hydroxy-tetrahydrodipicolinate synthase